MNTNTKSRMFYMLLVLLPLVLVAASAVGYDLSWWSADGGGGSSNGGGYSLLAVAGQPDAGLMQGGGFSLAGGLLGSGASAPPSLLRLFLPVMSK